MTADPCATCGDPEVNHYDNGVRLCSKCAACSGYVAPPAPTSESVDVAALREKYARMTSMDAPRDVLRLLDALAAERSLREAAEESRDVWKSYHGDACRNWDAAVIERDAARADLATAQATLAAVRGLHTSYRIFDECDCTPEQKDADEEGTHVDALDIGRTCNLMYVICRECCCDGTDREYQTEACANYHEHTKDAATICATIRALGDELPEAGDGT